MTDLEDEQKHGEPPLVHGPEQLEGEVDEGEVVALDPALAVLLEPPQVHKPEGGGDAEQGAARPPQVPLLEGAHAHAHRVSAGVVLGQPVPRARHEVEELGHGVQEI